MMLSSWYRQWLVHSSSHRQETLITARYFPLPALFLGIQIPWETRFLLISRFVDLSVNWGMGSCLPSSLIRVLSNKLAPGYICHLQKFTEDREYQASGFCFSWVYWGGSASSWSSRLWYDLIWIFSNCWGPLDTLRTNYYKPWIEVENQSHLEATPSRITRTVRDL